MWQRGETIAKGTSTRPAVTQSRDTRQFVLCPTRRYRFPAPGALADLERAYMASL